MDKIDKKLITLLQNNARMPLKALAENVFLSSPAVSARIERLEKEEIIEGYEVKINQIKLGYHITSIPLGATGVENTICVLVLPNFCNCPINVSSSIVLGNTTLRSIE